MIGDLPISRFRPQTIFGEKAGDGPGRIAKAELSLAMCKTPKMVVLDPKQPDLGNFDCIWWETYVTLQ